MKFTLNIKLRLILWFLALITLLLAFFGSFTYLLLVNGLNQQTKYPSSVLLAQITKSTDNVYKITGLTQVNPQNWVSQVDGLAGISNFSNQQLQQSETATLNTPNGQVNIDLSSLYAQDSSPDQEVWLSAYTSRTVPILTSCLLSGKIHRI